MSLFVDRKRESELNGDGKNEKKFASTILRDQRRWWSATVVEHRPQQMRFRMHDIMWLKWWPKNTCQRHPNDIRSHDNESFNYQNNYFAQHPRSQKCRMPSSFPTIFQNLDGRLNCDCVCVVSMVQKTVGFEITTHK